MSPHTRGLLSERGTLGGHCGLGGASPPGVGCLGSSPPPKMTSHLRLVGRPSTSIEDRTVCRASAGEERRWRQEQPRLHSSLDSYYESYHEPSEGSDYCSSSMTDVGYSTWDCTPGGSAGGSFDDDYEDCSCNPALECCDGLAPARPYPNTSSSAAINVGDLYFMGQTPCARGSGGATPILPTPSYRRQNDTQERTFNARVRQYLHAAQVGDILTDMNQPQQAEEAYTEALDLHLMATAALYAKRASAQAAAASRQDGDTCVEELWELCLADANQAISLDPRLAIAHLFAGEALLQLGRPQDAAVCLSSGLKLEPSSEKMSNALQRAMDLLPKNNVVNLTKQPKQPVMLSKGPRVDTACLQSTSLTTQEQ